MITLFEAFAGYGGASFALKKARIPFECVGYSEIDKNAIKIYEQNFKNITNFGDIKEIDEENLPDFDLFTGGFPCQDVSVAGKGDLSKGRTLLFTEIIRILKHKQSRYVLLENVKGLLSKRFRKFYEYTFKELEKIGYNVFILLLNSKDYETPQNRERVWYICFKFYDDYLRFKYYELNRLLQNRGRNKLKVKDLLEENVDKKYYLTNEQVNKIKNRNRFGDHLYEYTPEYWHTLCANGKSDAGYIKTQNGYRIITPKEAFRLMGFFNDEINIKNISDTTLYKLAGNGWDINLASKILKHILTTQNVT